MGQKQNFKIDGLDVSGIQNPLTTERLIIDSNTFVGMSNIPATIDIPDRASLSTIKYLPNEAQANFNIDIYGYANMQAGTAKTVALIITNGQSGYFSNSISVINATPTVKWQGGSAPSSADANSLAIYTLTIIKNYETSEPLVLADVAKFA